MNYRNLELSASSFLKQMVHDVYQLKTGTKEYTYSTVPNGVIGIAVTLNGKSSTFFDNSWQTKPLISVYGLINRPDVIKISKEYNEIAIGFKPCFMQLFLQNSMSELTKRKGLDAFDFFNKDQLNMLYERLYYAKNDNQILFAIETFLRSQMLPAKESKRLEYATNLLYNNAIESVSELSEALNLSSVSIRNLFREGVGLSPKEILRIVRIHKALQFQPDAFNNLTQLSYELGYFDQSHFIRDFKSFFGFTPSYYFSQTELTFDFYNYGRWGGDIFAKSSIL